MKQKLIIFDLDGVLFDTPEHVNDFFLKKYPTLTREIMSEMLTGNFHEELEKMKKIHKPIEETPEEFEIRNKEYAMKKAKLPMYPGIEDLLENLHGRGYIITINTSALEKNCLPLLEYSDVSKYFDFIATKDISTSKVEKFKIIKEKYGVSDEDMIFITDTLGDIREAEVANIPTIAVTWGAHNHSFFTREPHRNLVKIVDTVTELQNCLLG